MDDDLLAATLARVAANLRRVRKRRGWTQAELAERPGIDLRYLQRIEAAAVHAGVGYVAALATALEIDPGELFVRADSPVRPHGRPAKRADG